MKIIKTILVTICVILFGSIIIGPIILGYKFGLLPSVTEYWLQYLSIFLSGISMLAVIITIWLQYSESKEQSKQIQQNYIFAQQNYDTQLLAIIATFEQENLKECRNSCNIINAKLSNKDFNVEFSNVLKHYALGCHSDVDINILYNSKAYKCYNDLMAIVRHFKLLSYYNFNKITASAVRDYYDYYRSLFIHIHYMYRQILKDLPSDQVMDHRTCFYSQWLYVVVNFDKIMNENNPFPNFGNLQNYSFELNKDEKRFYIENEN